MAQQVRTTFDLGRGLLIGDPREDEARAKEASVRADKALRAQLAAQALAMSSRPTVVQGSPNAPTGPTPGNPWLRPDSRPNRDGTGGFASSATLSAPTYGSPVAFQAPLSEYVMRQAGGQVHQAGRPDAEALAGEVEQARQRKFAEDQITNARGDQQLAERKAETRDLQSRAASTLGDERLARFREGNFTDADVKEILEISAVNPEIGPFIRDILANPLYSQSIGRRSNIEAFGKGGDPAARLNSAWDTFTDRPLDFFGSLMRHYLGNYIPGVDTPQEEFDKTSRRLNELLMRLPRREWQQGQVPTQFPQDALNTYIRRQGARQGQ